MLPDEDPNQSSPKCLAIIIYYYYHKVTAPVVSKLIALKNDGKEIDSWGVLCRYDDFRDDCRERDIPWNSEGVGQELARLVDLDTFNSITKIDAACEAILIKASLDAEDASTACTDHC